MEPTDTRAPAPGRRDSPHVARNYAPLPVTITYAEGSWVYDADGRRYFDALAAYSALNFGHRNPALVAAAQAQLERLTLTSRAFLTDQLEPFSNELAALCGKDLVLTMNSGAEAVESAIKVARKWGYERKGVPADSAEIVVFAGNFHGRTTTIVSFSDDPLAHDNFGPFTPGFVRVPYGDLDAVRRVVGPSTVAVLVEPVQGEGGVILPPDGFLAELRELCSAEDVLLIADEIQSALGRTGRTFEMEREGVVPDVYVLGKALGGGILPLSAVVADERVLGVLAPGQHGSTFGGNPLACAVGRAVLALLRTGEPQARAARLGRQMLGWLRAIDSPLLVAVRGRGLWFGLDLAPDGPSGRAVCERLLTLGVLAKETHGHTIRLSPPITSEADDLRWACEQVARALAHP